MRLNQQRRVLRLRPVVAARRREGQRERSVSRAAASSSVSSSKMVRVAMGRAAPCRVSSSGGVGNASLPQYTRGREKISSHCPLRVTNIGDNIDS